MPNSRPAAIIKQRCPVCKEGATYKSAWKMHETCPVCGIRYERESGYFLMAMFFAYVLGAVVLAPLGLALYLYHVSANWMIAAFIVAAFLVYWPAFRYSRILWMHLDELLDPRSARETRIGHG